MQFKKIVGFGDSWMWGDELIDPSLKDLPHAHPVLVENTPYREKNCFLGLLGQHYGIPAENFGIPGGSQQSAIWAYLWWLEHEPLDARECLVLVGHTHPNRTSFYNPTHAVCYQDPPWNQFVHTSWVNADASNFSQDWIDLVKRHTVLTQCRDYEKLNYQQSVRFFEGQYHMLNHNVVQFCSITPVMVIESKNLIWQDRSLDYIINHHQYLAPHRHPNELGHAVIRDHLIPEIERVILA